LSKRTKQIISFIIAVALLIGVKVFTAYVDHTKVSYSVTAESIAEKVKMLIRNEEIRKRYGAAAAERNFVSGEDVEMLLKICDQE
jgi:hypothetical protein